MLWLLFLATPSWALEVTVPDVTVDETGASVTQTVTINPVGCAGPINIYWWTYWSTLYSFTYSLHGDGPGTETYDVRARCSSITGGYLYDTHTFTVTYVNVPPELAVLTEPPASVPEGTSVSTQVELTDIAEDTLVGSINWGDGSRLAAFGAGTTSVSHTYMEPGAYTITLTGRDDDHGTTTETRSITVTDVAPVVREVVLPTADEGETVTLEVLADLVRSDTLTDCSWTFGDGGTGTGCVVDHQWVQDGDYPVTVTVTDDEGTTATATATLTVDNVCPDAVANADRAMEGYPFVVEAITMDPGVLDTHEWAFQFESSSVQVWGTSNVATHIFPDDGHWWAALQVRDDAGCIGGEGYYVTVTNEQPLANAITGPLTGVEGDALSLTCEAVDPSPVDEAALTYDWTWGDSTTASGRTATHTWGDDGSYSVECTVTDPQGADDSIAATVVLTNADPILDSSTVPVTADEGDHVAFSASFHDPGFDDELSATWSVSDGTTLGGSIVGYDLVDDGVYTVELTVADDDGGTATRSHTLTVANLPPVPVYTGVLTGTEGDTLTLGVDPADPGTADTHTVSWDYGDGTTGSDATHAWEDDGSWTVTATVTDDDGASGTIAATLVLDNAPPVVTGAPPATASEGVVYTFAPGVTDPGTADTHTWTGTGGTVDPATGVLTLTPDWTQVGGSLTLSVTATDDDGAADTLTWDVEVLLRDDDDDGMSDGWEAAHGLDPATDDATGDLDGDGRSNLDEYVDGTDPGTWDGPGLPTLLAPADGDEVASLTPALELGAATAPHGDPLTYAYAVYADAGLTTLLTDATGQDLDWDVDVALTENSWVWWTSAADDGWTTSGWVAPAAFFVNAVNDPPSTPVLRSPFDGGSTDRLQPTLEAEVVTDPDGDVVTLCTELTDLSGTVLDGACDLPVGTTGTAWTTSVTLTEDTEYCWTAWATDEHGLDGPAASDACFLVDLFNEPPSDPVLTDPVDGSIVSDDTPRISATNGIDPEGRVTVHRFELDTDPGYGSADLQTADITTSPTGTTSWSPPVDLPEDTWVYARVAASDGATLSGWSAVSFFVSTANDAPPIPTLLNPSDGANLLAGGSLEVVAVVDPEGGEVTYDLRIDDGTAEVDGTTGVTDDGATASWQPGELEPGSYTWTARAVDAQGAASDWAEAYGLTVDEESDVDTDTDTDVDTDTDTDLADPEDKGCATVPGAGAWWVLLGLAALVTRRRG